MDGVLVDLLNAKWNTFVKFRFYRQFFLFCFYFILSLVSFTLRPGPAEEEEDEGANATATAESSTTEPAIVEIVTLSSLLRKNLVDQLVANLRVETTDASVELVTSQLFSSINSTIRDAWTLTTKQLENFLPNATGATRRNDSDFDDGRHFYELNLTNYISLKNGDNDGTHW